MSNIFCKYKKIFFFIFLFIMTSNISLIDNINYLLRINYDNNLITLVEYNQIRNKLTNLNDSSLYNIFDKLKYLKDKNDSKYSISTKQLIEQQNQLLFQKKMIDKQQTQINNIVNIFNDFNLEDDLKDGEINSRFNNISNDRRSTLNNKQDYLPRMNQPLIQIKQPRNSFEIDYQDRFQERNVTSNNETFLNEDDFYNKEKIRQDNFMKSQKVREKIFEDKAKKRFYEFEKSLQKINTDINAYQILQCTENCNIEDIKKSYKKLALQYHPDRGGNPKDFQLLTKAYLSVIDDYKKKKSDKNFINLKESSTEFMKEQETNTKENIKINNDNFNIELFNKIYSENRLYNPHDDGYNDWLKDNTTEDVPKLFSDKFNINIFNSTFENSKNSNNTQDIVEYKDPTPTNLNNELSYNNLGEGSIIDFSGNSNHLNYTDLKYAHTKTKLIDTRNVNIKQYNNVEDLEKDRSTIKYDMNQNELLKYESLRQKENNDELERIKRLKDYENKHYNHFNKVNKLFINNH